MKLQIKRIYDSPEESDGRRILVDRLWPRGLTREKAAIDVWVKEIAPSPELRTWYGHKVERWPEFRKRYLAELEENVEAVEQLRTQLHGRVTLLYATKDTEHNSARVLMDYFST